MTYDGLLLKIVLLPFLGACLAFWSSKEPSAARRWGAVSTGLTLAMSCALVGRAFTTATPEPLVDGVTLALASDGAVAVLAAAVALVHVGALVFTPTREVNARLTTALLLGEAGTMLGLHARSPVTFLAGWAISTAPLLATPLTGGPARLIRGSALISIASVAVATGLDAFGGEARSWPGALPISSIAWVIAALARFGAPPFHGWAPIALHRAPMALAVPAMISPLPALALVHLMERTSSGEATGWLLVGLGTVGSIYGAVLAVVQHDLRRAIGYVQVSLVSTLIAAIGTSTRAGVLGAMLGVAAGSVALSGMMFLATAIAVRTGTGDMRRLGAMHRSSPLASAIFLLCGVAVVGFPGTVGFVSEDLVMRGLMNGHPVAAVLVLIAAALNAVTLFRCHERTYLGAPSSHGGATGRIEDMLPRERWVLMLWAALIVIGGFVPAPLTAIESAVRSAEDPAPVVSTTPPAPSGAEVPGSSGAPPSGAG